MGGLDCPIDMLVSWLQLGGNSLFSPLVSHLALSPAQVPLVVYIPRSVVGALEVHKLVLTLY